MRQEPPWERAERYYRMMQEQGFRSIRALARAIGEDHSRIARILKVLELPQSALEALQRDSDNARLRAHFTERRLRQLVRQDQPGTAILREIGQVIQGCA
jgi:ParB-like chromosome segregation protein Spo0J